MFKVLIIKLAAIGDVIMALPMVDEIKNECPDAEITWVAGKTVAPVLEQFSIQHLIKVDESKLLKGTLLGKIGVVISLWQKLAFKKFNLIVIGHTDHRYRYITLFTQGRKRYFIKELGQRNFPIGTRHFTDEYTRLILNKDTNVKIKLSSVLPNLDSGKFTNLLTELKNKTIIAIAPGGAKNYLADDRCRRWPIENYVQLVKLILQQGYAVVLTGANSDAWVKPYFKDLSVVDLIGKTNLLDLVEIFQHCDLVITHDSGPMHLAGLAGAKLLALFGPTNPYEKIPRGKQTIKFLWDVDQYACCPCYDGKTYANCQDNICLRNISPARVLEATRKILKESKY
jgi:heptosyltransferase-2